MHPCKSRVTPPKLEPKLKDFLKELERYDLITALCTYSDILESLGHLTKLFEKEHILTFDVTSNVSLTKETLNELLHVYQTTDNVEQLSSKYFEIVQNGESYKLRKMYCRLGDMRKHETNREYKYLELLNIKNVDKSVIVSQKITTQVIPKLNESCKKIRIF
ncbi:hypothetical protein SNE40_013666 [Patella caerulea]|uniref:Uncharacterized protein n=1 Tax=Patella caerulea TaxID=87958 RepID=A0AAN8JIN9_PATCE